MRRSSAATAFAFTCALICTGIAGAQTVGSAAASNDPTGAILYVWLWLLPFSGVLSIAAYVIVIGQLNRSFAEAAARRGKPIKALGLFV